MAQQIFYAAAFPAADTEIYGRKGGELTTNQGTAVSVYLGSTSCSCLTGLILLQLSLGKPLVVPFTGVLETGMQVAPSARIHDLAKQEGTIHASDEGTDDTYPKTLNMECSLNTDDLIWRERINGDYVFLQFWEAFPYSPPMERFLSSLSFCPINDIYNEH